MKKPITYSVFGLGAAYLFGKDILGLTAKKCVIKTTNGKRRYWYYLYKNGLEVFDCNSEFFKAWFKREK